MQKFIYYKYEQLSFAKRWKAKHSVKSLYFAGRHSDTHSHTNWHTQKNQALNNFRCFIKRKTQKQIAANILRRSSCDGMSSWDQTFKSTHTHTHTPVCIRFLKRKKESSYDENCNFISDDCVWVRTMHVVSLNWQKLQVSVEKFLSLWCAISIYWCTRIVFYIRSAHFRIEFSIYSNVEAIARSFVRSVYAI